MKIAFVFSALVAAASAATPEARPRRCRAIPKLAKYDNIKVVPDVPELNAIHSYMGLNYTAFDASNVGVAGTQVTGLMSQSGSQFAGSGPINRAANGPATLTPLPPFRSFSLRSVFMGCMVAAIQTGVSVPQQCTVAFTAYKPGQSKVAFDTINQNFNPTNLTLSRLTKVVFPKSWSKMGKIEAAVVAATSPTDTVTLIFDNTKYNLYKCT